MAFQAGVGHSDHRNPEQAGKDAVAEAMKNAGIDKADFVMLFATVGYNQPALLSTVRKATGNVPLSGCSGEGVIAQNFGVSWWPFRRERLSKLPITQSPNLLLSTFPSLP